MMKGAQAWWFRAWRLVVSLRLSGLGLGLASLGLGVYWVAVKELKVTILGKPYYLLYIPIMVT